MAAQTTLATIYTGRVEARSRHTVQEHSGAMEGRHAGEQVLSPARGSALSPETVAIIPEMSWDGLSDEALVARYREEADKAVAEACANELFRRHHAKVARWCLGFTGDRESALDLAQEIFIKAYRNLSNFKGDSKFSTWLYSITRNHGLNAVRSRSIAPAMESEETVIDTLPDLRFDNPLKAVERKQLTEIARQFVNEELDETEKTVFTLHYAEEVSLDAITRMLNLENTSGAKAYLVSARRKLDRAVKRWKAKSEK